MLTGLSHKFLKWGQYWLLNRSEDFYGGRLFKSVQLLGITYWMIMINAAAVRGPR